MLVSLNWLKDYVDIDGISAKEFCDKMILSGSNLETCEEIGTGMTGVVLGRVDKIDKHPDADKLVICQVNVGEETLQIVTGAPNVCEGAYVAVATHGSIVPGPLHGKEKEEGGTKITKGKLRGVESAGMLCSMEELGYSDKVTPFRSKDGIWLIEGEWDDLLGEEIGKALLLEDYQIDFEITPNRPDCLSMIGMARETVATFEKELKYPETDSKTSNEKAEDYIQIEVNSDFCKRYTARVIKDVKVAQSPWWLQKRLIAAGMRPINNIVDITNFVMLEYGQPLHAFDISTIEGNKIIVDVAKNGDKFTTLDGKERTLDAETLMINDAVKPIGIAGIMGGLNSEIVDTTSTVVIESANFNADNVRRTSKALVLRTEASGRYEKGIDSNLCEEAADRVCHLIEKLECGTVLDGSIDIYKNPEVPTPVKARVSRINKVIGIELTRDEIKEMLERLEMKVEGEGDELIVTPPSIRQDIEIEVDIVEEVARMYGYDNIPMTLPETVTRADASESWKLRSKITNVLCSMGLNEIKTFSFLNDQTLTDIGVSEDSWERGMIKLINPMGEDTKSMRTTITPGMIEVLGRNCAQNNEEVKCFEIGKTYAPAYKEDELPDELYNISLGMYGEDVDFFTLKGVLEEMLRNIGINKVKFVAESEYGVYHPGRCARVLIEMDGNAKEQKAEMIQQLQEQLQNKDNSLDDKTTSMLREMLTMIESQPAKGDVEIGIMGELHPDVAEKFGINKRAYVCELIFDIVLDFANENINYKPLPKYPSTSRDIAVLIDDDMPVGKLLEAIDEFEADILENVELFDIYRGEQVADGKKSVALSITYRHADKTLTDEETEKVHAQILEMLNEKFGATLREV